MKAFRLELGEHGIFLIDVVCDCGNNALHDEKGNANCKHPVKTGNAPEKILVCNLCGRKYRIVSQIDHVHVFDLDWLDKK